MNFDYLSDNELEIKINDLEEQLDFSERSSDDNFDIINHWLQEAIKEKYIRKSRIQEKEYPD